MFCRFLYKFLYKFANRSGSETCRANRIVVTALRRATVGTRPQKCSTADAASSRLSAQTDGKGLSGDKSNIIYRAST